MGGLRTWFTKTENSDEYTMVKDFSAQKKNGRERVCVCVHQFGCCCYFASYVEDIQHQSE